MKLSADSIIFDLDGTLWDSTETIAAAWQAAIDQLDFVDRTIAAADVRAIAGMPYDAIYDKLFPTLQGPERLQLQSLCARLELDYLLERGGKLYEGLPEILDYLQGKYTLAIVSNCQRGYIEAFLAHHHLQAYFTDHDCYGNRNLSKAENIHEVIRRNGLQQPVYVGDTQGDYEASRLSRVPFILAGYGFGQVAGATVTISQLSDLRHIL